MQVRAETTKKFLLEAAAQLFDEKGYAGTSISDISNHSGRTSGAIYFHYASKESLALAIVEEHFATWPGLINWYSTAPLPALEKLVGLSFDVARAFRDDIVVRAGARIWSERKAIARALPVPFIGWVTTVTELLEEAAANGELASHIAPDTAAHSVVCSFFGLHTVSDALQGRHHIEDQLGDLWLLLLSALQASPDPTALLERVHRKTGPRAAPLPTR